MVAAPRANRCGSGNLGQMLAYARTVRRAYEEQWRGAGPRDPVAGLADAESQVAVPAMVLGQLVGVLVDRERPSALAFGADDEALLTGRRDAGRERDRDRLGARPGRVGTHRRTAGASRAPRRRPAGARRTRVRFFAVDGSTFLDGDYLIKGVAGRILWALLGHYDAKRPRGVHQQGSAPRPYARAPRVPRQPREPAHPAEAPPRRARARRSASRRPAAAGSVSRSRPHLRSKPSRCRW